MRDIGINLSAISEPVNETAKLIKNAGFTKVLADSSTPKQMKEIAHAEFLNAYLNRSNLT